MIITSDIFYYLLSIFISIISSNSNINISNFIKNITLDKNYSDNYNQTENINYLLIIPGPEFNFTNNTNIIKMQITNLDKKINHNVISYYQDDSTFTKRKQLSYNINNITLMWLTKDQIKKDFYVSIEFGIIPCFYKLDIFILDNITLNLGEQYTYFVSKENEVIAFDIIGKVNIINEEVNNNTIVIWAKGNKEISTNLNPINHYIKHPKYNIYIIKVEKEDIMNDGYFHFNFKVDGKEDDLINIGSLFFNGSDMSICSQVFGPDLEIMGFLKRNLKDKNCYKIPQNINNILLFQKAVFENKEINIKKIQSSNDNLYCVSMPDEYDEIVYTIYYFEDDSNNYLNNLIRLSPLINNIEYFTEINKNSYFGLIPMKQNNDIDYITYYLNPIKGKYKIGVYLCETYPLCTIDNNIDTNINYKEINYLNSFSVTYSKSEDNNILNKISKRQNIIIIKSDVGSNEDNKDKNQFYINIYTQKYTTLLKQNMLYSKYIRRKNYENYLINHKNDEIIDSIYIFIEIISGEIEINNFEAINHTRYKDENKRFYIIHPNYSEPYSKISFKITPKSNSFYNIMYIKNIHDNEIKFNFFDGNYLFNLNKNKKIIINTNNTTKDIFSNFISFNSINCLFNIKTNKTSIKKGNNIYNFYQEIITNKDSINKADNYIYELSKNKQNNNNFSCLFYLSLFKLESKNNNYLKGIILTNNISQSFMFNNNNSNFNYLYLFSNTDKNLYINIKLFDKEKYQLILFKKENNSLFNINSNQTIKVDNNTLKFICENERQICNLHFSIISNRTLKESKIEINPNYKENIDDNINKENNSKKSINFGKPLLIIALIGGGILILIIIVIIIFISFSLKNKELMNKVNTISFKYEESDRDEKEKFVNALDED